MCVCSWISTNLPAIGLAFDLVGATLMVGTKFSPTRKVGFWLFPGQKKRVKGYQTLLKNGEIEPDDTGFFELRKALFPTGEERIFASDESKQASELFSDEDVEPIRIKKETFPVERLDNGISYQRRDLQNNIVMPEHVTRVSELHYIADETPHISNVNGKRKLRRSYDDVDETLERLFESSLLNFGLKVLIFGFLLQLIAVLGIV